MPRRNAKQILSDSELEMDGKNQDHLREQKIKNLLNILVRCAIVIVFAIAIAIIFKLTYSAWQQNDTNSLTHILASIGTFGGGILIESFRRTLR